MKKKANLDTTDPFYMGVVLPYKVPQLVKILWVDAYTEGGAEWLGKDDAQRIAREPLPHMLTVGFVLYSDNEQVSVTNTIGCNETAQVWKIPKRMIINIKSIA